MSAETFAILWLAAGVAALSVFAIALCRSAKDPVDEGVCVDVHWAGVEAEWHAYIDSFGVLEEAS